MTDEPFLITPPPSIAQAAPRVEPETPAAPSPAFITLPPVIVESATYRLARERVAEPPSVPAPVAPGIPFRAAPPTPVPVREATVERPNEDTDILVTRGSAVSWRLDLPHGMPSITLTGPALLGRNPSPIDGMPDATLVAIADPAKSVSKTHALVEPDGDALWVTDLASTNGVVVTAAGGSESLLPSHVRTLVTNGATVRLGDLAIVALRR